MGKKDMERIKKSAFYQEIEKVHKKYFEVLGPLSVALFGDAGYTEYDPKKMPVGSGIKTELEDTERSGVMYGMAVLLSQGMSMDDILDPTKELDKKRAAGDLIIQLSMNKDRAAIFKIYEEATLRFMDEITFDTKDNLLDNANDIRNAIIRKAIFDMNQRFGLKKEMLFDLIVERYKKENEPNYEQLAKERYEQVYSATEYVQALQTLEWSFFEIFKEINTKIEFRELLASVETWNRIKEELKKLNKESTKEFRDQMLVECTANRAMIVVELERLQESGLDLEAYLAEVVNSKNGLENIVENAKKFKEKELQKAEKRNQKTAEELEILSSTPDFSTIMDIRYNYNQVVNEIGKTFYGDDVEREVSYGEDLNFVLDGLYNDGGLRLEMSGMSYAAAVLLAEGMKFDTILDPSAELELKKQAGERVKELAERGEAGRRELALLAAKAMEILENENYSEMSENRDTFENEANFKTNFATQMMEDLEYETEHTLNLKEAFEYQVKQENPELSDEEVANRATEEYERIQSYGKSYKEVKEFHEFTETKMSVEIHKKQFEQMYKELLEVDPMHIKSSPEFKGMRNTLEEIINLLNNAEQNIDNYERELKEGKQSRAFDNVEFYQELSFRCTKLEDFNNKYLKVKEGIKLKAGSNAKKRLIVANKLRNFVRKESKKVNKKKEQLNSFNRKAIKNRYVEGRENVKNAIDRCYDILSPSAGPNYKPANPTEADFMEKCFAVKKEENDFKIPKELQISEKQAGLLVLISLGTVEVGQEDRVNRNGYLDADDIYNMRNEFFDQKMQLIEKGRGVVKEALDAYASGDKSKLANMLREGLKRYDFSFSSLKNGLEQSDKIEFAYKIGSDIYDMLSTNTELKELLSDKAYGSDKITKETMQNCRAAKMGYEIYKKAEEAKKVLIDTNLSKEKSPDQVKMRKEALAALVLKNILNTDIKKASGTSVGKFQRELTPEKVDLYLKRLANSKTIEKMEKHMEPVMLKKFEYEEKFCGKVVEAIMKDEASLFKVKETELEAEANKQKQVEEVKEVQVKL